MSSSREAKSKKIEPQADETDSQASLEIAELVSVTKDGRAVLRIDGTLRVAAVLQSALPDLRKRRREGLQTVIAGRVTGSRDELVVIAAAGPSSGALDKLVLQASSEIEIRCGKSAITLHADGKVSIRGVDVTSRASRSQKIKGASVNIN